MYIKNILFTLFALFTTISISQENNGWLVDYEEVYAKSIEQDKPIMANFTGSDWCGWCKKLKKVRKRLKKKGRRQIIIKIG